MRTILVHDGLRALRRAAGSRVRDLYLQELSAGRRLSAPTEGGSRSVNARVNLSGSWGGGAREQGPMRRFFRCLLPPMPSRFSRAVIHVDLDAFFASIEQRAILI